MFKVEHKINKIPLILVTLVFLCPMASIAFDCSNSFNWKDIGLLPTNGNADKSINVKVSVDQRKVEPGDYVTITFKADKDCYLTLMDEGTSGKIIRLWPNDHTGNDNFVRANETRTFPGPNDGFKYKIAGPGGVERIVAYATSEKNKILGEAAFQDLKKTGFKQYRLGAKDLEFQFRENTEPEKTEFSWGTSQVNLCISTASEKPAASSDQRSTGALFQRPSSAPSNAGSGSASTPVVSSSERTEDTSDSVAKTVLLAIGAPTGKLLYSDKDAKKFTEAIKSRLKIKGSDVKVLLKSEATYDGVVKGMKWLASKTGPEDQAIIYFSGHGTSIPDMAPMDETDGKDECFVLHHTTPPEDYKKALASKVLMKDDDFNMWLKRIPARKKFVVADACHSGTIMKANPGKLVSKFMPFTYPSSEKMILLKGKSAPVNYGNDNEAIMAACKDNQQSYEDQERKSGLFTYHLLKAMDNGAENFEEAFEIAKDKTISETKHQAQVTGGTIQEQTPTLTDPHEFGALLKF